MRTVSGCVCVSGFHLKLQPQLRSKVLQCKSSSVVSADLGTRRGLTLSLIFNWVGVGVVQFSADSAEAKVLSEFVDIPESGGVKVLQIRQGLGKVPVDGDKVAIHYYARLAAKQGWRFDSTYDHKDQTGDSVPFVFTLGSGKVIAGVEAAVKTMKVGDILRVVIPPSQGYQNTSQEPLPPNFLDGRVIFVELAKPRSELGKIAN